MKDTLNSFGGLLNFSMSLTLNYSYINNNKTRLSME